MFIEREKMIFSKNETFSTSFVYISDEGERLRLIKRIEFESSQIEITKLLTK